MNLETLSERITEAILQDAILTKENIVKRVKSILIIWNPIIYASTHKKKNTDAFIRGAERKRIELNYWKEKARSEMTKEEVEKAYI
jgi:hypothetical protein